MAMAANVKRLLCGACKATWLALLGTAEAKRCPKCGSDDVLMSLRES